MIIAIYLAANRRLSLHQSDRERADSRLIAADTMVALFGQIGVAVISVVVMISTFGSLMGSMVASPRIFFAMADDRLFFKQIAAVHSDVPHAVGGNPACRASSASRW